MAKKRSIALDDLFKLNALGHVAISPDGRQIAFEQKRADLPENKNFCQLMLVDAHTRAVRPLTEGKFKDFLPKWSPDGTRLAFLSDREKVTTLFVLPMTGGAPVRITDRDGDVSDFDWSPDGRQIVYAYRALNERQKLERDGKDDELKKRPQFRHVTRLFHKLDGCGWWNGHYTHVHVISSSGGRAKQLSRGDYDDREPRFSPDGKWVSFISNRVENPDLDAEHGDIFLVRPSGGKLQNLTNKRGSCAGHSWSPDSRSIAFVGNPAKAGESWKYLDHVWVVQLDGGKPVEITREIDNECRNVTIGDLATSGFEVGAVIWSADSAWVYFLVSEGGATHLYRRSLARRDLRCEVDGDVNVFFAQRTAPAGPIALALGTHTNPGDVHTFDPESGALERLTDLNGPLLQKLHVAEPEPVQVKHGGVSVHGWVLKPPGFDPRRKHPAIVQIHGGPHTQYGHSFYHELQWLAAQGFVVLYTNPRGSIGYGLDYRKSIHADWGNLDYRDVMAATDWLVRQTWVDAKRLGVTGGSYGGFMTNWIVGHSNRFRAAVTQRSVVNLESMFGTSDYGYDLSHEFGGLPWECLDLYRKQSPLSYVKNIRTPLLIEHEEQDHRCPIEQGEQLFTALKALGREVELVRFEGESHGLCRGGRPQNRAERLRRILGWFRKHIPTDKT